MIEPLTPVVELHSRLGRVGSIQGWNPWDSRKSPEHAKWWVSKIASLSYGNEAAKNPEALFKSIVERGHLSCLEFVPFDHEDSGLHLPCNSLRMAPQLVNVPEAWGEPNESAQFPATAFLVECPLYTRSQWMRHRSFSYLEMSRRYTKGSKVEWSYYGHGTEFREVGFTGPHGLMQHEATNPMWSAHSDDFHKACEAEYQRRLDAGWPNEIARGCLPMEAMTRFWVAGFNRDWDAFIKLRDDPHAQPEIQVFARWIRNHIHPESTSVDVGNLGT